MPPASAVCIVVDRLHAGMVGAYGNAGIRTPSLDRLASHSVVFDQALINGPRLENIYEAYWRLGAGAETAEAASLISALARQGVSTTLVTDEPSVARHPLATSFGQAMVLDTPAAESATLADEPEETAMAHLFAAAGEQIASAAEPQLLWVHARGMAGAWDAPYSLRQNYADEDDPLPSESSEVPSRLLGDDFDPDEVLDVVHRYSGQVSLMDMCIGALLEEIDQSELGRASLVMLLSARGFPLGEHGRVGPADDVLYGELVQVPWLMRLPDRGGATLRCPHLVQPGDLAATLAAWWELPRSEAMQARSLLPAASADLALRLRAYVRSEGEHALRTPAWYARQTRGGPVELYAKPDDRWEVNQVADRCTEVAATITDELAQLWHNPELVDELPANELLLVADD